MSDPWLYVERPNSMSKNPQVDQIRQMKRELQEHYDRFKELRASGQNEEALKQFNVTLKVASDLMTLSTQVLKGIAGAKAETVSDDFNEGTARDLGNGKVLLFPNSNQVH